jgi:arylsulfatase A
VMAFWDMLPTLAEIGGGVAPQGIDGISMAAAILGKPQKRQHEYLYWEFYEKGFQQAVRMGDWKGVRLKQGEPIELYDLKTDQGETKNIAAAHPDVVARIEQIMRSSHTNNPYWPDTRKNAPQTEG